MKMLVTRPGDPQALEDRLLHAAPFPQGHYGLLPSPALRFSPPSPCTACPFSTNSDSVTCHWGWGLSLKRAAAPEPLFCKVRCVLSPSCRPGPCHKLVRPPTAWPLPPAQRPGLCLPRELCCHFPIAHHVPERAHHVWR